ncbi:MFS transporter [Acidobacteriota bacterium]
MMVGDKRKISESTRIVFFASVTHFMVHLYENSFSGILKFLQAEWNTDYTSLGSMGVPLFFLFGLMAIPGGWLSDRFGSKRLLLICLFGAAGTSLLASLTRGIGGLHPMVVLGVLLAILGLFTGIYHPAGLSFISRGVKKRGRAMGIHGIMGNLGLASAPFLAVWLAESYGWRKAFLVFGFPALVIGMALLFSPFRRQAGTGRGGGSFAPKDFLPQQVQRNLLHPLLVLYAISALNGLAYRGILVYLPAYFKDELGHGTFLSLSDMKLAGMIASVILLMGLCRSHRLFRPTLRIDSARNLSFLLCHRCFLDRDRHRPEDSVPQPRQRKSHEP